MRLLTWRATAISGRPYLQQRHAADLLRRRGLVHGDAHRAHVVPDRVVAPHVEMKAKLESSLSYLVPSPQRFQAIETRDKTFKLHRPTREKPRMVRTTAAASPELGTQPKPLELSVWGSLPDVAFGRTTCSAPSAEGGRRDALPPPPPPAIQRTTMSAAAATVAARTRA
jgi:hypothetical protein